MLRVSANVSDSDVSFFLLCCARIWYRLCASVFHSSGSFLLLNLSACGHQCMLLYPRVMGRSSVGLWPRLYTSASHSDGLFILLCCGCVWPRLCASVSHSDGSFSLRCCILLCCVWMWPRLCASVYLSDGPLFLLCYVCIWSGI